MSETKDISPEKILVIFDFDDTITDEDSVFYQSRVGLSKEDNEKLLEMDAYMPFMDTIQFLYTTMAKYGKTKEDLDSILKGIKIDEKMINLLTFFHENSDKFELILVTGNSDYPVKKVLNFNSVDKFFKEIYGYTTELSEKTLLKLTRPFNTDCKNCNPNMCKTFIVKEYIKKSNIKYKNIFYVCDGGNDYCLAENLEEKDYLFVRKDHRLFKKLYDKGLVKNLKCKIFSWNSGGEILDEIKKIK